MTPEERQLLEKIAILSTENNEILRGIRRSGRIGVAFKILYWIIILGISYGAYVYIQPYVEKTMDAYQKVTGTMDQLGLPLH